VPAAVALRLTAHEREPRCVREMDS
jgi:hypothetical protein